MGTVGSVEYAPLPSPCPKRRNSILSVGELDDKSDAKVSAVITE